MAAAPTPEDETDPSSCVLLVLHLIDARVTDMAAEFRTVGTYDRELFIDTLAWASELTETNPRIIAAGLDTKIKTYAAALDARAAKRGAKKGTF